jgi:hypothetical protein
LSAFLIVLFLQTFAFAQNKREEKIPAMPKLLSLREQMSVRSAWLKKRFDTLLLPMMRKHNVAMWIVTNEEFHSDAVTESIVPPVPMVGRRDFFIFFDNGNALERFAVVRYEEEQLKKFYTLINPARDKTAETIRKIVEERKPQTIALNMGYGRGQADGITHDAYKFLAETLGKDYESRFVSAGNLVTDYLDTRIPDELEHYSTAV